jgi:hypothetical protein
MTIQHPFVLWMQNSKPHVQADPTSNRNHILAQLQLHARPCRGLFFSGDGREQQHPRSFAVARAGPQAMTAIGEKLLLTGRYTRHYRCWTRKVRLRRRTAVPKKLTFRRPKVVAKSILVACWLPFSGTEPRSARPLIHTLHKGSNAANQ